MKHFNCLALLFISIGISFGTGDAVAGDAEAGKSKAVTCFACHGENGVGIAETYPNLAGQKQGYLVSSVKAYKDGSRTGGLAVLMAPMVSALSDEDISDIAAYYSGLE
jgi:cytochrome c553